MPAPPLETHEIIAGRFFKWVEQTKLDNIWRDEEAEGYTQTINSPTFMGSAWRHECPGRNMISTAMELKEKYNFSPELKVYPGGEVEDPEGRFWLRNGPGQLEHHEVPSAEGTPIVVPASRFGFLYKDGLCKAKGCGQRARSKAGRFVDAVYRPPVEGRVARASH